GSDPGQRELHRSRGLIAFMREVAVKARRDAKHSEIIHRKAEPEQTPFKWNQQKAGEAENVDDNESQTSRFLELELHVNCLVCATVGIQPFRLIRMGRTYYLRRVVDLYIQGRSIYRTLTERW